jgi:hypothetical protein
MEVILNEKIEKIVYKYLDFKRFIVIMGISDIVLGLQYDPDYHNEVYFVEDEDSRYAKIRIISGECLVCIQLLDEVSEMFSLDYTNSRKVIGSWVGNTLKTEINSVTVLPKSMLTKDGIYFNIKKIININDKISD